MNTIWFPNFESQSGPKYLVLSEAISAAVRDGHLKPVEKLPPVRELAYQIGVTPGTVARAYSRLVDRGVLEAVVGRGTFVSEHISKPNSLTSNYFERFSDPHGSEPDRFRVSMMSPHLPNCGQAQLIRNLLSEIALDPPSGMMHYPSRDASEGARNSVAQWLSDLPMGPVTRDDIVLTNGGQSGILTILQTLLRGRKPVVLVEELSYPVFRRAAEMLRAEVVPVQMDEHGVIPASLEAAARAHEAQVFCTSPEVHNPTCVFTPEERRREIAAVAERCNFDILEDDCYRMGQTQASNYRRLAPDRGWYVGSISKALTPSLRLGYVVAPRGRAGALRRTAEHSFFGLATPLSDLCERLLVHPEIKDIAENVRLASNEYVEAAVNILGGYDLAWRQDVLFLWLTLPSGWRANAFCQAAEGQGVQIRSAEDYQGRTAPALHAVRIAVNGGVSLQSFEAAIGRLRDLLDNPMEGIGV